MKLFVTTSLLLASLFAYSQGQNSWSKRSTFGGQKRTRAVAFSIGNYGYVGMGEDTVEMTHNDLWRFDPSLNTWAQMTTATQISTRRNATAVTIGTKGYVGLGADSSVSWAGTILADWWEYDPGLNDWSQKANYPGGFDISGFTGVGGVYFSTAFAIGTKGYVCGGKFGSDLYGTDLWEYDPQLDQWTRMADFPGQDRYQLSSFALEGRGYVGMGVDHDLFRKDWWEYDPILDSWSQVADLPGSERGAASTFVLGQRGFVVFGGDGGYKDELWEYNSFSNTWTIRANFSGGERKNAIAFAVGDTAYAGIGSGPSGKRRNFYAYSPLLPVGIDEQEYEFSVYPNPCTDHIVISGLDKTENVGYTIHSVTGRLLFQSDVLPSNNKVNLNSVPSGTYVISLIDKTSKVLHTEKLMVQ